MTSIIIAIIVDCFWLLFYYILNLKLTVLLRSNDGIGITNGDTSLEPVSWPVLGLVNLLTLLKVLVLVLVLTHGVLVLVLLT